MNTNEQLILSNHLREIVREQNIDLVEKVANSNANITCSYANFCEKLGGLARQDRPLAVMVAKGYINDSKIVRHIQFKERAWEHDYRMNKLRRSANTTTLVLSLTIGSISAIGAMMALASILGA